MLTKQKKCHDQTLMRILAQIQDYLKKTMTYDELDELYVKRTSCQL